MPALGVAEEAALLINTYLQSDVGAGPVLQVSELEVCVPVHKVDTQQLLAFGPPKARKALA